jgi:predicted AAA+ superfamily ATPase
MPRNKPLETISEDLILSRLRFENPWWATGELEVDFSAKQPREYYRLFQPMVEDRSVRRAVVLMGPRRVGKTVMMHHSIGALLAAGIDPQRIAYINIENPIYNNIGLERLFELVRRAVATNETGGWFVFYDEIQYLKNWEVHLKVLVDSYPRVKFVASGSAAAALKMKSQESGAGRFTDFMLPPLTFHEFLSLKGMERIIAPSQLEWKGEIAKFYSTTDITELNRQFVDYLNFGGYPEVIFNETIRANPGRFIRNDIVDKVLLRDLPSLYGIQNVQELNSFFTTLAYNTGQEVSLESLSSGSGVDKATMRKYLEYLEAAFLIKIVHRVDETGKRFRRATLFKVYLTNPSLRSALFAPLSPTDDLFGAIVETAIIAQWMHRDWFTPLYARWNKGEVDMVGLDRKNQKPSWALEIKWSNRHFLDGKLLSSLTTFCKKTGISSAMVTTIDKEGTHDVSGIKVQFVPAALYAYVVGANTLDSKLRRSP